jgi:hypothetical protein
MKDMHKWREAASVREHLIQRNCTMKSRFMFGAAAATALASTASAAQDEVMLFNGRNFDGWTFFLEETGYNAEGKGRISDFASIKPGGVIEINPQMHGALMTQRDYLNYDLHVEYRWVDPAPRDDSGIFVRIRPPFVWDMQHGEQARFYMIQIQPGNTGDLWVLGYSESLLKTDPKRSFKPIGELELTPGGYIRRHLKMVDAERKPGEWNSIDTTVDGKTIKVSVNGRLVNEGTAIVDLPGRIGLESERGVIQYRNIRLKPRT